MTHAAADSAHQPGASMDGGEAREPAQAAPPAAEAVEAAGGAGAAAAGAADARQQQEGGQQGDGEGQARVLEPTLSKRTLGPLHGDVLQVGGAGGRRGGAAHPPLNHHVLHPTMCCAPQAASSRVPGALLGLRPERASAPRRPAAAHPQDVWVPLVDPGDAAAVLGRLRLSVRAASVEAMEHQLWRRLLPLADLDGNGTLTHDEFASLLEVGCALWVGQELRRRRQRLALFAPRRQSMQRRAPPHTTRLPCTPCPSC